MSSSESSLAEASFTSLAGELAGRMAEDNADDHVRIAAGRVGDDEMDRALRPVLRGCGWTGERAGKRQYGEQ